MIRRRRAVTPAALIAVAALMTGCTLGPSSRPDLAVYGGNVGPAVATGASTPPTGPGGPGQNANLQPDWHTCSGLDTVSGRAAEFEMSCAGLPVPVSYPAPQNGRLTVAVARARTPGLADDAPTLVVIMGNGPLDSSTAGIHDLAATAAALPDQVTAKYQIVGLDIRGSGDSVDADCLRDGLAERLLAVPAQVSAESWASSLADITRDLTFNCQDYVGPQVVFYGTTQVADDLDSLRSALSHDTLNLVGVGYGATVGAVYASRYPARVGRLVLDSPTDHSSSASDRAVAAATEFEHTLQSFAAACAVDPTCALGADAVGGVKKALTVVSATGRATDSGWDVSNGTVLWALILALPDQSRWPDLATAIAEASNGDLDPMGELLTALLSKPAAALSLRLILDCNDSDERLAANDLAPKFAEAATAAPVFGAFMVGLSSLCSSWPAPESPLGALRAQGAAPILVIGGVHDAGAPYAGVQAVANQLASATLISYLSTDHGAYPRNTCIADQINPYLINATLPPAGVLCPA